MGWKCKVVQILFLFVASYFILPQRAHIFVATVFTNLFILDPWKEPLQYQFFLYFWVQTQNCINFWNYLFSFIIFWSITNKITKNRLLICLLSITQTLPIIQTTTTTIYLLRQTIVQPYTIQQLPLFINIIFPFVSRWLFPIIFRFQARLSFLPLHFYATFGNRQKSVNVFMNVPQRRNKN